MPGPEKPYAATAAQHVEIPRGLSRTQKADFLARDLKEALAYEPTSEELGESVIDLTGDVTPQSAPAVSEPSLKSSLIGRHFVDSQPSGLPHR